MAEELKPLVEALKLVSSLAKFAAGVVAGLSSIVVTIGATIFGVLSGIASAGLVAWGKIKDGYNEHIKPLAENFRENWRTMFPVIGDLFSLIEGAGKAVARAMTFASQEIIGPIQTVYNDLLLPIMAEIEDFIAYVEGSTVMGIYNDATKATEAAVDGNTNFIGSMAGAPGVSDRQVINHFTNKFDVSGLTDRTDKKALVKEISKMLQDNIRTNQYQYSRRD